MRKVLLHWAVGRGLDHRHPFLFSIIRSLYLLGRRYRMADIIREGSCVNCGWLTLVANGGENDGLCIACIKVKTGR